MIYIFTERNSSTFTHQEQGCIYCFCSLRIKSKICLYLLSECIIHLFVKKNIALLSRYLNLVAVATGSGGEFW